MAANGLAANPSKTTFIILNDKQEGAKTRKVQVGEVEITQERSAKLLGVTMDDSQKWNTQIYGKGGTLSSLSSRMFIVKRIQNQVGKKSIKKIVDSLYMSKIRYGLPLFGKIKWKENDTQEKWLTDLQFLTILFNVYMLPIIVTKACICLRFIENKLTYLLTYLQLSKG